MSFNFNFVDNAFFSKLNNYFEENNIKWSLKTKTRVFIVTKNDLFYEINIFDEKMPEFILNNDNSIIDSMIVEELCNKSIVDIKYGFQHYITRSVNNKMYFMGKNKSEVNKVLSDLEIKDLECGDYHTLALTFSGYVYAWGVNEFGQIGNGRFDHQIIPMKLNGFDSEKVVMISCGRIHSMALTKSGRVFSWGDNLYGQLGLGNRENSNEPKLIEMNDIIIKKLSGGHSHSMLLSNNGDIYVFGDNYCGQLGIGSEEIQTKPMKLNHKNKFIDIASHFSDDISVSLSEDGIHYVWGYCRSKIILSPLKTICKSFDEVFTNYSNFQFNATETLFDFKDLFFRSGFYHKEYQEVKELGSGSFGTVFKAMDKAKNYYAIKKIKPKPKYENEFMKEFINYSVVAKFQRKLIVSHFDAWFENYDFKIDGKLCLYIAMELCDKTLEQVIDEIQSDLNLKIDETLTPIGYYIASHLFIEILNGVLHLHKNNLIHKDLCPSNILVKKDRQRFIKIGDFGLTSIHKYAEQNHAINVGHIKFMAPEVGKSGIYDSKADIYSLGWILRELFDIDICK
jgi:hypothetical protein